MILARLLCTGVLCTVAHGVGRVVGALGGFDAQLGHLYDACTSLPQKSQAAIKWLEIKKKKKIASVPTRGSRHDFPSGRPGRTLLFSYVLCKLLFYCF